MAVLAATTMGEAQQESKVLHPFFSKPSKSRENLTESVPDSFFATKFPNHAISSSSTDILSRAPRSKTASTSQETDQDGEAGAELLEVDPNHRRRKRRKSVQLLDRTDPGALRAFDEGKTTANKDADPKEPQVIGLVACGAVPINQQDAQTIQELTSTAAIVPYPSQGGLDTKLLLLPGSPSKPQARDVQVIGVYLPSTGPSTIAPQEPIQQPRKMLRLDPKAGTIGSPPAKPDPKRSSNLNTKPKKSNGGKHSMSKFVTFRYGHDRESQVLMGKKIEHIRAGVIHPPVAPLKEVGKSNLCSIKEPSMTTHPFFLGKAAPKSDNTSTITVVEAESRSEAGKALSSKTHKMFTTPRPCSPIKYAKVSSGFSGPTFGHGTKIMKFPGAVEPCWPPNGMVHIRGSDTDYVSINRPISLDSRREGRKSKLATVQILACEEVIRVTTESLRISEVEQQLANFRSDEFFQPENSLRVPEKHFESGLNVQNRVRRHVYCPFPTSDDRDLSNDELYSGQKIKIHPALNRVYHAISTTLTSFDRSTYETQSWINKYAPRSAAEVLQCGKEAFILKDWLLALTVVAVDTGVVDNRSRGGSAASKLSASKRKRKSNKLEGFVISSDEEGADMDEISEAEDDTSLRGSQSLIKRTVVRAGDVSRGRETGKLSNAVVINGPNGCGKTAMVYAVARELGFEVFEINSSSRRSGKDVLEKVGDMTRNHQVQRSKQELLNLAEDDSRQVSESLEEDLKSGRQGTMDSFFKSKTPQTKASTVQAAKEAKPIKSPPKQQKQSLILLEEVDVLFEEDKQFWSTVLTLLVQSKRPVIMTCNDEALVPFQSLNLHAIIRLTPPPLDLSVDYMLLVAAAEGHVITRRAVQTLFEARKFDLRASLTELNYWCQLGVGDCKGGLDWFYPRWPPGSDMDDQGHTIKVVSENTYRTGMGWLSPDFILGSSSGHEKVIDIHQEVLREVWDGWQIDIATCEGLGTRPTTLASYDDFIECMSAADVYACGKLSTGDQKLLDTTIPPLSTKSQDDFVLGLELLEADDLVDFDPTTKSIAFAIEALTESIAGFELGMRTRASRARVLNAIASHSRTQAGKLSRSDFSIAFDPIAEPERKSLSTTSLECSVFDRTISMIAVDVAPYVRSIVAHDARLQQERARLSNLLSEGGRKGKRMRTTRAALSALEGGARSTTRPDRYFESSLNSVLVLKTGLASWRDVVEFDKVERGQSDKDEAMTRPENNNSP